MAAEECKGSGWIAGGRPLYDWEAEEARKVFNDRLRYDAVRVHECASWTDLINRVGSRLKHLPPPATHNAVTLGFNCFFPVLLPRQRPDDLGNSTMPWLIHELTHAWQYQHLGWAYLPRALEAQFRLGARAYDFGGPQALAELRGQGWTFWRFNPEQQGDICRTYYRCYCANGDSTAWMPYIQDVRIA